MGRYHSRENSIKSAKESLIEHLYNEKLHKSRSRKNSVSSELLQPQTNKNIQSLISVVSKLTKSLNVALLHLDFDFDQSFDRDNFFIIMKYLGYATVKDENFITHDLFKLFNKDQINYNELKSLICAIEGVY